MYSVHCVRARLSSLCSKRNSCVISPPRGDGVKKKKKRKIIVGFPIVARVRALTRRRPFYNISNRDNTTRNLCGIDGFFFSYT